jgi:hypothetical protein
MRFCSNQFIGRLTASSLRAGATHPAILEASPDGVIGRAAAAVPRASVSLSGASGAKAAEWGRIFPYAVQ